MPAAIRRDIQVQVRFGSLVLGDVYAGADLVDVTSDLITFQVAYGASLAAGDRIATLLQAQGGMELFDKNGRYDPGAPLPAGGIARALLDRPSVVRFRARAPGGAWRTVWQGLCQALGGCIGGTSFSLLSSGRDKLAGCLDVRRHRNSSIYTQLLRAEVDMSEAAIARVTRYIVGRHSYDGKRGPYLDRIAAWAGAIPYEDRRGAPELFDPHWFFGAARPNDFEVTDAALVDAVKSSGARGRVVTRVLAQALLLYEAADTSEGNPVMARVKGVEVPAGERRTVYLEPVDERVVQVDWDVPVLSRPMGDVGATIDSYGPQDDRSLYVTLLGGADDRDDLEVTGTGVPHALYLAAERPVLGNIEALARFGPRDAVVEPWFHPQGTLDGAMPPLSPAPVILAYQGLIEPLVTLRLPFHQEVGSPVTVEAVQPGQVAGVTLTDDVTGVTIDRRVLVLSVSIDHDWRRLPSMVLRCIGIGARALDSRDQGGVVPALPPEPVGNVPGAPTGLSVTATAVDGFWNLAWDAPANDGGQRVDWYEVEEVYYPDNDPVAVDLGISRIVRSYSRVPVGLGGVAGGLYTFRVRAVNVIGASDWSDGADTDMTVLPFGERLVAKEFDVNIEQGARIAATSALLYLQVDDAAYSAIVAYAAGVRAAASDPGIVFPARIILHKGLAVEGDIFYALAVGSGGTTGLYRHDLSTDMALSRVDFFLDNSTPSIDVSGGVVFGARTSSIRRYDAVTGDTLSTVAIAGATSVATDGDLLYVAPGAGADISAYEMDGTLIAGRDIELPDGASLEDLTWAAGVLYVAAWNTDRIYAFSAPLR